MACICYKSFKFTPESLAIIDRANAIVTEYEALGYNLTLRQVYYQFVARDWLPKKWADPKTGSTNNVRSYKNLGGILNDARLAGLMDWDSIEDRLRKIDGNTHWRSPEHIIHAVSKQYMIDKWRDQKNRPEVWVEKDALEGVVGNVCRELDIPYFSCRGYTSQSAMHANALLLKRWADNGIKPIILHVGDHDPSGLDMSNDIEQRIRMYLDGPDGDDDLGHMLTFQRIALNMDQVRQYNPPPNPAKTTDSRSKRYIKQFGNESWELDALDPRVLADLIRAAVLPFRDTKKFNQYAKQEKTERRLLEDCSNRWNDVKKLLAD